MRAALSVAVVVALNEYLAWPPMAEAALAAWLTCLCDQGGPIRRRLPAVLTFPVLGAIITVAAGFARAGGLYSAVAFASIGLFVLSFARVYGQSALVVGNLAGVALVLGIDRPLTDPHAGLMIALGFLGGGLWAAALTMLVWRVRPFLAARRAVAAVYVALAALSRDLNDRMRTERISASAWADHARAHRRRVRDLIEQARSIAFDTMRVRGATGARGAQVLIRLETADQIFETLIALSELVEQATEQDRAVAGVLLRRVRPLLLVLGRTIVTDDSRKNFRIAASIDALAEDVARLSNDSALRGIADALVDRLRIALTLSTPQSYLPENDGAPVPWRDRIVTPLLSNLSWDSLALRHAARACVIAAPAIAITVLWYGPYERWLTITMVLTLQPQFALTLTRAVERIGGTMLGGFVAAALTLVCRTPVSIAVAMFPLAMIALAVRQVSYGAFIAAVTPIVVLLSELGRPGTSGLELAGLRALFTLIGGLLALAGGLLLWPVWEPAQLQQALRAALSAHARLAAAAIGAMIGDAQPAAAQAARRSAGVASNNLEASLSRVLQEPRHVSAEGIEAMMVVDAALRRVAGRLAAIMLDPRLRTPRLQPELSVWSHWTESALETLAAGKTDLPARPPIPSGAADSLGRLSRQIELMTGAMARLPG